MSKYSDMPEEVVVKMANEAVRRLQHTSDFWPSEELTRMVDELRDKEGFACDVDLLRDYLGLLRRSNKLTPVNPQKGYHRPLKRHGEDLLIALPYIDDYCRSLGVAAPPELVNMVGYYRDANNPGKFVWNPDHK